MGDLCDCGQFEGAHRRNWMCDPEDNTKFHSDLAPHKPDVDDLELKEGEVFAGYIMDIRIVGPDFTDSIKIVSRHLSELEPKFVDQGGVMYERYAGDKIGEYVEIRSEYVVLRQISMSIGRTLESVLQEQDVPDYDVHVTPDMKIQRQERERAQERQETGR